MRKILAVMLLAITFAGAGAQEREIILYAHRGGGRLESDENTLSAFEKSYDAGIRAYETDVRLTKDGIVVISHDNTFQRTCGDPRHVEDLTAAEIRQIRTKQGHPILFLDELVDWCKAKGDVDYFEIEFKTTKEGEYPDERIFIDGNPLDQAFIDKCAELGVKRIGAAIHGLSRAMVRKAHENGFKVNVWPGQVIEDSLLGVYLEADGLCSDIPVAVKQYLEKSKDVRLVCD